MALIHAGLLLLLFGSAYTYQFRGGAEYGLFVQNPELEWERMETVIGDEMERAPAPETKSWRKTSGSESSTRKAKGVPQYRIVSASQDHKEVFKPEKGFRPLPNSVINMLFGSLTATGVTGTSATTVATTSPKLIEILCHVDRMYVRVRREVFKTRNAWEYLKLGTCPVKASTKDHYYLLSLLEDDCGFQKESSVDMRTIRIVLHYKPTGPVLREKSFDVPLQCKFPRFFHSFKVGFYPKLEGGTVFKALKPKGFTITPQDASGNKIVGAKTYTLGQPMYFEAKQAESTAGSGAKRIYINKCFMTASQNPNSNPKYTVIDNQGCMIDGVVTDQSKFITDSSKMTQKFSVGALIFQDNISTSSSSQQLYMHCEVSMGILTPTQSSKACNYDPATKKWKELYGDDSVCACCDSTCPSAQPKASRDITSSHSWKVDLSWKDRYAAVDPWMKSYNADTFSLEDPDMAEHEDFLKYWEHDY
ncbi:zona pellucida sperm-binding protein 3 [Morone saxatilis]|uniref:zona pellucida sperm-binding protein 3 n=1 Tax=Morone saxatilis TaxID=34816 RepID=UPI0015E1C39F|nr:zona pellucida sperm-binding protein 3 [Morone saxatilis]